ncbi:MAG: hypothetical protein KY444_07335, partial [Gemmatimonadetes bacterium]|nr:hypothetical protein [Gemmatimonadota bacterium]
WWERVAESVRTSAGEWAREAWDDLRARARRAVGAEDGVDRDAGTRPPRGEDASRPEPAEAPAAPLPESPPVPEDEPRDTMRIEDIAPSAPRDTLFIPDPAGAGPPAPAGSVEPPADSAAGAAASRTGQRGTVNASASFACGARPSRAGIAAGARPPRCPSVARA